MKVLDSNIFDIINNLLSKIQNRTGEIIGFVSLLVPFFTVIKVLITRGEKIELEKANFFLIIYLFICLISNFTSSMVPQSLYGFMKTTIYFCFYFAMCQFLKSNKQYIVYILAVLAFLVFAESLIGISQNFVGLENNSTWQDMSYVNPEDVISRIYGTLKPYNPNLFAGWLIAAFPALFGLLALVKIKAKLSSKFNKVFYIAFAALISLSILAIFLSGCRGAYIALFAIFLAIVILSFYFVFYNDAYKCFKRLWIKSFIALCSFSTLFIAFNHSILKRIMSIFIMREDSSTSFRMNVYLSAVEMFKDNWIQGIGVGNKVFREIYGLYMLSGFDALSCYCIFLEMAVESGIFALLAFILFIYFLLKSGFKVVLNTNDNKIRLIAVSALLSIIAVMVHGFVDTVYFRPQVQFVFWTMAAILLTLSTERAKGRQ